MQFLSSANAPQLFSVLHDFDVKGRLEVERRCIGQKVVLVKVKRVDTEQRNLQIVQYGKRLVGVMVARIVADVAQHGNDFLSRYTGRPCHTSRGCGSLCWGF